MSVDVEEWFHIPAGLDNVVEYKDWDSSVSRVEHVLPRMLDLFDRTGTIGTFFFLGWIAKKHPQLVRLVQDHGHEIATHGYFHKMIYNQSRAEFEEDILLSKSVIESISGQKLKGYRAPGFSITPQTTWSFDILAERGFEYDSSVFPANRYYGHFEEFGMNPALIKTCNGNKIIEFPQSIISFGFFRFSFFGGGYFRLFPEFIFNLMAGKLADRGRPLILYIHPRDIDSEQPVIDFPVLKKFRHYINISKTEQKISNVMESLNFTSFEEIIASEISAEFPLITLG